MQPACSACKEDDLSPAFYSHLSKQAFSVSHRFQSTLRRPQATLTERALELLALPDDGVPRMLLDLGCGSGLSGEALSEHGYMWTVRLINTCDIEQHPLLPWVSVAPAHPTWILGLTAS